MADNIEANSGSGGGVFATDEIAGVHHPRTKVQFGVDGSATDVSSSAPLPVVQTGTHTVQAAQSGAWEVELGSTSLAALENTTVTVGAAIPAGTNNIGDVDVLTLPALAAGSNNIGDVDVVGGTVAHDGAAGSINPVLVGGYGSATAPSNVSATNDAVRAWYLLNGAQATVLTAAGALIGGDAANGLDVDITRLPASTNTIEVVGDAAHDAAIAGNPLRVGGHGRSSDITAVSNGDTTNFITDLLGKQIVLPYAIPDLHWQAVTTAKTDTSDTAIKASAGAGLRNYITSLTVTNSHATVGTVVEVKDGSTVIHRAYAAPAGGGYTVTFPTPLKGTAATAVNVANVTTGSNTYVSMSGYIAP